MKDIVIRAASVKRELFVLGLCLVLAECANLGAIIKYDRPLVELFTQLGFVLVLTLLIYAALWLVRLVVLLLVRLLRKR